MFDYFKIFSIQDSLKFLYIVISYQGISDLNSFSIFKIIDLHNI